MSSRLRHILSASCLIVFSVLGLGSGNSNSGSSTSASTTPQEVVTNSSWDGSVRQVERYLKKNLKDPDSYEAIEWSKVVKNANGTFMVRCKYRAKNSFGGYVIENQIFVLDAQGNVTGATDAE